MFIFVFPLHLLEHLITCQSLRHADERVIGYSNEQSYSLQSGGEEELGTGRWGHIKITSPTSEVSTGQMKLPVTRLLHLQTEEVTTTNNNQFL